MFTWHCGYHLCSTWDRWVQVPPVLTRLKCHDSSNLSLAWQMPRQSAVPLLHWEMWMISFFFHSIWSDFGQPYRVQCAASLAKGTSAKLERARWPSLSHVRAVRLTKLRPTLCHMRHATNVSLCQQKIIAVAVRRWDCKVLCDRQKTAP